MKSIATLTIGILASAGAIAIAALRADEHQGYLIDADGRIVMSGTSGLCVRDSAWTPQRAIEPCDWNATPVKSTAQTPSPPSVAAQLIEPIAAAPVEVSPPPPRKFAFSADALFAFDRSTLKPAGKTMLDDLARRLDGVTYDTILATGHTDRFGSDSYNQKLSERRARVVRDYLVSRNVQADRISAEGKGRADPVTKAGACKGPRSAKVFACLQADRRVDVDISGAMPTTGTL